MKRELIAASVCLGMVWNALFAVEEPQFIFEGQVNAVDAPLAKVVQAGDVLSGVLTLKVLTPKDQLAEDTQRGRYEDFLMDAEATLDRHYVALLSSRYDSERAETCHTTLGKREEGLPQTLAYAIPLKSGFKSDREFTPIWVEFWLYDTRGQMLANDGFLYTRPNFEAGTFRITFQGPADGGMAFVSGSVTRFGPPQDEEFDAEAEIAELERIVLELNGVIAQQNAELARLNAQVEQERSRQRYLEEQLRQAQERLTNVVSQEEADALQAERDEAMRIAEQAALEAATARDNAVALEIERAQMIRRNDTLNARNEALQSALITAQQDAERWREAALVAQETLKKALSDPAQEGAKSDSVPAVEAPLDEYGVLVIRKPATIEDEDIPVRLKPLLKERPTRISRPGTRRYPQAAK